MAPNETQMTEANHMNTMTHSQLIDLAARGNARAVAELARRAAESARKSVL